MVAFLAGGLATCGSPSSPCAGVDCSSHGACFSVADAVYCECARNYHAVGLECIADSAVDPCLGVTCDEHGTCRIVGRGWVCDCGSGYYFDSGHCLPGTPCEAPWGWCDGACVDLESDEANCGGCSLACALGQPCTAGACGGLCPPETTWCGDRCHDLTTDREHCGACGRACATTEVCCAGACRTGTDHAGADLVVTDGTELTGLHGGLGRFEVPAGARLAVAGGLEVCADTIDVSGLIDATGRGYPAGIAGEAGASRSPGVSGGAGAGTFGGGAGGGGRAGGGWGCNSADERPHNPGEPGGSGLPGGYLAAGANGDVTVDRSLAAGSGGGGGGGGGGGEGSDCCGLRVEGGRGGSGGGGGAGGAAVALRARRSVSVAGTIRASGLPGAAGAAGRAGDRDSARDPQHAACVSACGDCDACGAPADHRYSCCPGLGPCGSAANDCCQRPCCYNYYGGTGGDGASGASGAGGGVLLDAPTVVFAGAAVVESLGGDGTAAAGGTVKLFTDGVLDAADRARLQAGRLCVAASGAADCTPVP